MDVSLKKRDKWTINIKRCSTIKEIQIKSQFRHYPTYTRMFNLENNDKIAIVGKNTEKYMLVEI